MWLKYLLVAMSLLWLRAALRTLALNVSAGQPALPRSLLVSANTDSSRLWYAYGGFGAALFGGMGEAVTSGGLVSGTGAASVGAGWGPVATVEACALRGTAGPLHPRSAGASIAPATAMVSRTATVARPVRRRRIRCRPGPRWGTSGNADVPCLSHPTPRTLRNGYADPQHWPQPTTVNST